jgi:hypothetical protein
MNSRKATALLKGVIAAIALVCLIALATHPVAGAGLLFIGLLFVPVLLWLLRPVLRDALPVIHLEQRRSSQTWVLVYRFQRPPPQLL